MARFTVQMTLGVPAAPPGLRQLPSRPGFRALVGDGRMAVTASVRAESPAQAAMDVVATASKAWRRHGRGPVDMLAWTATEDRVLFGRGRRTSSSWPDDDPGEGTAGVREPRRPKPSPGSLTAER